MRISLRRLVPLLVVPFTATCVDSPTGPRGGTGRATLAIAPVFTETATTAKAIYAAAGLEIDQVRLLITRPPAEVVRDTIIPYNISQGDLPVELNVVGPVGEQLTVRLEYLAGTVVLYSGTAQVTSVSLLTPASQVTPTPIVIAPVGPGSGAASVTITPPSGSFPTTAPIQFTAKAFTSAAAEITGALFDWTVDDQTVGTINAAGTLQPTAKGGPIKVRATTLNGVFAEANITLTAPAASISLVSGGGQTGAAGSTLTQIVVKVADANGNGVAGEAVTFAVATGGGSIVVNNGTTDAAGLARVTWTLGSTGGTQSITATRVGLTGSPLTISATATPSTPTRLGFLVQPTNVAAGSVIAPAVQVAAQDAGGNTVTSFTGTITLAIGTNLGGAALGGTVTVSAVAGIATFNTLTLNAAANGYTLVASSTGLTGATSSAFNVTGGAATSLEFVTHPANTPQNSAISPPVQVRVKNAFGATVNTATNIVTIAIGTNPGGSTLGGNVSAAAVAGVATFSTLTLDVIASGYTLTASASGLTGATSNSFAVIPPAAVTRTWTGGVSAAWTDGGNWSPVGVPTVSDSVIIATGGSSPTLSANATIRALVIQSGAVLNVGAIQLFTSPGKITNQGSLNLTSSIIGGALDNPSGTIVVQGGVGVAGAITNGAGAMLRIQGNTGPGAAGLVASTGITNDGTIELIDFGGAFGASLSAGGTITNTASGSIGISQGNGGQRVISGAIANAGQISISSTQGLDIVHSGVASTSSGTIDLSGGGLTITQTGAGASFTTTGPITIASGEIFSVTGGAAALGDGLVTGAGTVDLNGVAVSFTPRSNFPVITSDAATVFNGGTLAIGASDQLTFLSSSISSNVSLSGMLTMRRTNSITGTFSNVAGSTLRAFGIGGAGNLTIDAGFTNNGTIQLTDSTGGFGATLTVTSGTLVNPAAGLIQPLGGAGGSRTLAAELNNAGTLTISGSQGMTLSKSGAAHTNSASFNISTGNLTITQTAGGTFTNTGTVTVPTGRTLTVTGGSATLGDGLVTGVGSVDVNGVALSFTPRSSFPVITSDAATVFNGGTLTIGASDQLTFLSSTISSNVSLSGTLTMRRTNSIAGTFSNTAGSVLRAMGVGGAGNLTIAAGFTNNGTIQLTDSTGGFGATLTVTTGTLVNPAPGLIEPQGGAGGSRTLAAELSNAGTITVGASQGMTLNRSGAVHANSGTINLTTGDLTVTQAAGGTFTTTGPIIVPASRTLTFNGGSVTLGNGLVTGAGAVVFNGVAASFEPRTLFPVITSDAATAFNGGTLVIPDTVQLTFLSSTISSNLTLNGLLTMRRTNSITGVLTKGASSTLRAMGVGGAGNLTIAAGFTNNGTIQLTDSTGGFGATLTITTGTLLNPASGQIQPLAGAGGSRTIAAQLNNAGTITVSAAQGMTLNRSGAAHTSSGPISLTTGDLTVTQAAGGSFTTTGTIAVPSGRTLTINGGSATLGNGLVTGAGAVVFTGVAASFEPRTLFPVITSDAATVFNGGTLVIPDTVQLTFLSSTIASNVTLNGQLTMRRTNSITGTLTKGTNSTLRAMGVGGAGNLTVAAGFTNNGTIQLTDSTGGFGATLTVTTGTLLNPAAGQIQPLAGAGGSRTIAAQLSNVGTITIGASQGMTLNRSGAAHTSSGTISLSTGDLTVTQAAGGSFTTTGTITVPSGRTLTINGGSATLGNGLVTGAGAVVFTGVAAAFEPRTLFPVITSDASTVFNGGTLAIADTVQLTFLSSTIGSNVTLNGQLTLRRTNSITGTLTKGTNSTLRAMGVGGAGNLTIAAGFTNNGTIQLTDSTGGFGATLTVTTGTLVNPSLGQIQPLAGAGGSRTIAAQLNNAGTITISASQGLTLNRSGAAHTNSGTFNLSTGDLTVTQAAGGSFTTTGPIIVPASRTLTFNGGSATLGNGFVTGAGAVVFNGATASFEPRTLFPVITSDATTVFNGGTLVIPDTVQLTFLSSTISSNVTLNGQLTMRRTNSMTGVLTKGTNSTLRAMGVGGAGNLTIALGFTNNGTIQLTDSTGGFGASLTIGSGTLTNAAGATISPLSGSGGSRTLTAAIIANQGNLTVPSSAPLTITGQLNNSGNFSMAGNSTVTLSAAAAAHTNSGTISLPSITSGTLNIGATSVTQSFTNTGTVSVGAGRTLALLGNTAFTNGVGGTYTGPSGGTLSVAATSTFTNNGTIAPGGVGAVGTMNYSGVWNPGSGGTLTFDQNTSSADLIAINGNATIGGALTAAWIGPTNTTTFTLMSITGTRAGAFSSTTMASGCVVGPTNPNYTVNCTGAF